jgi:hypothetical protein
MTCTLLFISYIDTNLYLFICILFNLLNSIAQNLDVIVMGMFFLSTFSCYRNLVTSYFCSTLLSRAIQLCHARTKR